MKRELPCMSASEYRAIIAEWILNERNRRILCRRLIDGVTLDKIAEEFDMSTRHINNIIKQGLETILAHIN